MQNLKNGRMGMMGDMDKVEISYEWLLNKNKEAITARNEKAINCLKNKDETSLIDFMLEYKAEIDSVAKRTKLEFYELKNGR